jgi:steroid 5-alpha reductase family enzyme
MSGTIHHTFILTMLLVVNATMNNGLLPYWGLSALCSSVGFLHPVYTISYGYGMSMIAQSAYRFWDKNSTDTIGKIHVGLVGMYGLRMVSFLLWRSGLKSYKAYQERDSTKKRREKVYKTSQVAGMVVGCSALYMGMFVPAFFNSMVEDRILSGDIPNAVSAVGLAMATIGLGLESVYDVRNQLDFEEHAVQSPSAQRPYRINYNYVGEALFWIGGFLGATRTFTGPVRFLGALPGVAGIVSVVVSEGFERYKRRRMKKE